MPAVAVKKEKSSGIAVLKKMKDYSNEEAFKKKAAKAIASVNKYGLPKSFTSKSK